MPALKLIQLKHDSVVTFKPITQEYGRAEFIFCTQWKASKLQRFFIYPMQQPDAQFYYEVPCGKSENFSITAWTHKGMTEPNV